MIPTIESVRTKIKIPNPMDAAIGGGEFISSVACPLERNMYKVTYAKFVLLGASYTGEKNLKKQP